MTSWHRVSKMSAWKCYRNIFLRLSFVASVRGGGILHQADVCCTLTDEVRPRDDFMGALDRVCLGLSLGIFIFKAQNKFPNVSYKGAE